nr:transposase [Paratractidigestivibacter sp.]
MCTSLLKKSLGLRGAVAESVREEGGSVIVSARPRRRSPRCPVCGRACGAYDRLAARRWRALDLGGSRCYVEYAPLRAECPEHGVRAEAVPWARSAASRFASAFEDEVAWPALHMCRSALAALMRVDWHTVGGIRARVEASLEAADGRSRLDGLRRIGVDETSYKKGHKYMAVVVDHDRGRVVWAAKGHGKRRLNDFLDLLTDERRAGIEVVAADGARWVADVVAERLPAAELAVDPSHAVSWATDALDGLRREAWREARSGPRAHRGPGRPHRGEGAPADPARAVKGLRFPLLKNPEDLTGGAGLRARGARGRGRGALARLPAEGGAAGRLPGPGPGGGRRARPLAGAGVPEPHPAVRRALAQGEAQARRHPALDRARRLQRPRRGGEQQDQGGDQAGLRLQERRQPHSARHAQVLGPEACAAGQGDGVTLPTHTNSRSLENLLESRVMRDGSQTGDAKPFKWPETTPITDQ